MFFTKRKVETEIEKSLEVKDKEITKLMEKLHELDPTDPNYEKVSKDLKSLETSRMIEARTLSELRNNRVPEWAARAVGTAVAVGMFVGTLVYEAKGGMIGTSAGNFWDKMTRPFR